MTKASGDTKPDHADKGSCSEQAARRIRELISTHHDYLPASGVDAFAIRDLLTDIRHFCDHVTLSFHETLANSYPVYLEEQRETLSHPASTPAIP